MDEAIRRHLASHHGVISRAEAIAFDMSERQIENRLRSDRWERVAAGVYRVAGAPATWRGKVRAAALSLDGLASHGTAATVHGIDGWDHTRIHVVVDQNRRPDPRSDVSIRRSTQMALAGGCEVDGIPVTGLARTTLDVAADVSPKRLDWTIDAVLRNNQLTWSELYAIYARSKAKGRDGGGPFRRMLDDRFGDAEIPDSIFNRMVGQLLVDQGIDWFHYEYELFEGTNFIARADLAFPEEKLVIECDSKAFHMFTGGFESDRKRSNRITLVGWTVLQFTWKTYVEQPGTIVDDVRDALELLAQKAN